jgi:ribonucleases P/MRP protein subunit RPP40
VPLYKGKGARNSPSSYRPISLCSCVSKLLERVVSDQLIRHISLVRPLSASQHGFRAGRSTVSNLLACDAAIASFLDKREPFDIISFDFERAFDKVPHDLLLQTLGELNLHPCSLRWFNSFLRNRTQRVIIGKAASITFDVTSGVPQGSVLSPTLFCIFIDSLLRSLSELIGTDNLAYADDLKFVTGTSVFMYHTAQQVVHLVGDWAVNHRMTVSVVKSGVLHCGADNPERPYDLDGRPLPKLEQLKDLGVLRSTTATYSDHINSLVPACNRLCGALQRVFRSREPRLLWSAFQTYVKPKIMYAAPVWSPFLKNDVTAVERVQRRFTKRLAGMSSLTYSERLTALNATTLENERRMADMVLLHRCLHGQCDYKLSDIGIALSANNERSGKVRFEQSRHVLRISSNLFSHRAVREWNSLPCDITSRPSLYSVKPKLLAHLMSI